MYLLDSSGYLDQNIVLSAYDAVFSIPNLTLKPGAKHLPEAMMMTHRRSGIQDRIQNAGMISSKVFLITHPCNKDEV